MYNIDNKRKVALRIAAQDWDFVNPEKLPPPGTYPDFLSYISEKIEMSVDAVGVKNRAGYIVEAIRENYEDPELQKARELRAEKAKEKELEDLTTEFNSSKGPSSVKPSTLSRDLLKSLRKGSSPTSSANGLRHTRPR